MYNNRNGEQNSLGENLMLRIHFLSVRIVMVVKQTFFDVIDKTFVVV